jgi:uncharacterized protein (TIGR02569 family)
VVPAAVLTAFGAHEAAVRLPGGQGTTWRSGEVVLKPAEDARAARWTAELYRDLSGPGFRVPRPVRATSGDWVADGWVAWRRVPGEPAPVARWTGLVAASRAFHAALAGVPAPPWLGQDGTQWTVADQVAWLERDPERYLPPGNAVAAQVRRLLAALGPVELPAQLVHGDLAGNVLFAGDAPPAVIDFSPYWRPAGLAVAVAAVDALTWAGASPAILDELADEPGIDELLARAHAGRLVTEIIARADGRGVDAVARAARPVTDLLLARLGE